MSEVRFAHIGKNHLVQVNRVMVVLPVKTKTARRYLEIAKGRGTYVDASRGRPFRSEILMDDGTVITSCIGVMTLLKRFSEVPESYPTNYWEDDMAAELLEQDEDIENLVDGEPQGNDEDDDTEETEGEDH